MLPEPTEIEIALSKIAARLSNRLDLIFTRLEHLEEVVRKSVAPPQPTQKTAPAPAAESRKAAAA